MATHTVEAGDIGIAPYALTAGQVDEVVFESNVGRVQLYSDGSGGDIWVRLGGEDPVVPEPGESTACFPMPGGAPYLMDFDLSGPLVNELQGDPDRIKIVAVSGTPKFGIWRLV